jgi:hypothetical protein
MSFQVISHQNLPEIGQSGHFSVRHSDQTMLVPMPLLDAHFTKQNAKKKLTEIAIVAAESTEISKKNLLQLNSQKGNKNNQTSIL